MLLVFLLTYSGTAAAPTAPIDLRAELGFGDWIVPGAWIPLRIDVATREAIDGELIVRAGAASGGESHWRYPVQLAPATRARVDLGVVVGDPRRPVGLSVEQRGATLASTQIVAAPLRVAEGVVIGMTHDPAGLEIVAALPRGLRAAYLEETQLPRRWQDYEGVALLVIRDLIDSRLLPAQREALVQWVGQGGRLLVTAGESPALHLPWLRAVLPVRASGITRSVPIPTVSGTRHAVSILEMFPRPSADVLREGATPVSARWYYGRGVATVWAFDPFTPAARAWPARKRLWSTVLEIQSRPAPSSEDTGRLFPVSPSLPGRSQAGLALLIVLYVLAVRYAQRRWVPRAGWLGLLGITVIFGLLMYASAVRARAASISSTQLTVLETLADLRFARAATYVAVANPYGSTHSLRAPEDAALRPLDGVAVTYVRGSNDLTTAGRVPSQIFESLQMLPQAVTARITDRGGRAELAVRADPSVTISSPVLFLRGRIHGLPDFSAQLSVVLDPTRWEGVDVRSGQIPQDIRGQVRAALFARLREVESLRERPWLIGWVTDPRSRVSLSQGRSGSVLQLLVAEVTIEK